MVDGLYAAELDLDPATWATVLTNAELYLETEIDGTPWRPRTDRRGRLCPPAAGVTNGAIGELQLAAGAVTEDKLDAGAVTAPDRPGCGLAGKTRGQFGEFGQDRGRQRHGDDVEANAFWQTDGNTAVASGSFIGTTDGTALEVRCGNNPCSRPV